MYAIHQTKSFILDYVDSGESNRLYWLFTPELGVVVATASGVRSTKSKLNPRLQKYSLVTVEIVKGKELWRITNVLSDDVPCSVYAKNGQAVVARTAALVRRLYAGEEPNPLLFTDIEQGFMKLQKVFDAETIAAVETLLVLKILYHLGYWEEHQKHYPLHVSPFSSDVLVKTKDLQHDLREKIILSLRESHL